MRTAWRSWPLQQLLWFVVAAVFSVAATARGDMPAANGQQVRVAELPQEARDMLQLIRRGGPYPNERDGITFGNYEKLLPAAQRGFYREYTVVTPGVQHRGARRIVVGCAQQSAPAPSSGLLQLAHCRDGGAFYYTADHYRSFRRIVE